MSIQVSPNFKVYIVDDDPGVRHSLRWLLESVGLNVETYAGGEDFLAAYEPSMRGCLVLDQKMPGRTGLEVFQELRERGCQLPVIMLTAYGDVSLAVASMKAGAIDFLEKPLGDEALVQKIQEIIQLEQTRWYDHCCQERLQHAFARLSPRERQVLELVVEGKTSRQIAQELRVSFKTIESHRTRIMQKLEAQNLPQLLKVYYTLHPQSPNC